MANKMLIDASHPEETRVVVTRGNRIEEFDFESQDKKQLKGNIYLARVTRVEPSLQAAFVEYGGNRHGFLAFSEIHPDYYQIPVADRQALLRDEEEAARLEDEEDDEASERASNRGGRGKRRRGGRNVAKARASDKSAGDAGQGGGADGGDLEPVAAIAANADAHVVTEEIETTAPEFGEPVDEAELISEGEGSDGAAGESETDGEITADAGDDADDDNGDDESNGEDAHVEMVGAGDAMEEVSRPRRSARRNYKIQEVIKRRQILLVQVVKEERGNKGAALTTYLSLAGRYSVLMPNTARGGGISRKITNAVDRKRLKDIVKDLEVPQGMGVILRTAGANRTKPEIKRDYEYLMRMWENVRNFTLQSTAPALVYEEGSLIKRSVRDLYNKDIDEVLVAGEDGYREAKDFMRMLMPSHAKAVQPYRDPVPLYVRHGVEAQLERMVQPQVTLKSGGYIIINQTEALVAIDVNSGRSTKEHSIEDTALQTNLEAAEEVARQLRLRDMAGLIVIDFIDMEEKRNNRSVEKKLKDCLRNDRARIQVGRISPFGLLEMSRQRIRASVLESTMQTCPHCGGTGHVRSESSVALYVLRAIEEYLIKDGRHNITVRTPVSTALYVLNHKRANLVELEARFGLIITVSGDEAVGTKLVEIDRGAPAAGPVQPAAAVAPIAEEPEDDIIDEIEDEAGEEEVTDARAAANGEDGEGGRKRRRRRRRRRGGRDRENGDAGSQDASAGDDASDEDGDDEDGAEAASSDNGEADSDSDGDRKKRRRGKRGGRRNRRGEDGDEAGSDDAVSAEADEAGDVTDEAAAPEAEAEPVAVEAEPADEEAAPKPKRRSRAKKAEKAEETPAEAVAEVAEKPKPKRTRKKAEPKAKAQAKATDDDAVGNDAEPAVPAADAEATAEVSVAETVTAEEVLAVPTTEPAPAS
ncbi:MAG: ribonuclease E/G, partial [Notoacmeibacter sp.]|nr:ribonuclease E/G [Notoacmeibacter sp.]